MKHELEAMPFELRMKKLYEYAKIHKDTKLLNCLGFITTDYIEDKNALPLSVYRIRKIIEDINSKGSEKIEHLKSELSLCFGQVLSDEAFDYINDKKMIKSASKKKPPVFRRAS